MIIDKTIKSLDRSLIGTKFNTIHGRHQIVGTWKEGDKCGYRIQPTANSDIWIKCSPSEIKPYLS